jgi:rhodanese-related sulfurtransferase
MALSTLLHRLCTVTLLGIVAGGVHSLLVPISLVPEAPPKLDLPVSSPSTPVAPVAGTAPGTGPGAATGTAPTQAAAMADGDITLAQARALYEQSVMFVDARSLAEFTQEHVEGAVHLPLESLEGGVRPDALSVLDPSAKIVIYCGGGDCHASHDVAIRLNALGFKSCYVLKDGFPAWKAAGYEVIGGAP